MPRLSPLPIDDALPALLQALREGPSVVLEAPPGAGKTTRVPPAILDAGLAGSGQIIVLEPRRLAARLSAKRVSQERGERPGETIGYTVRFEDVGGPRTRIRYVTEGVLTRRLLAEPTLPGVTVVVLDEFHERHLQGDLALACLLQLVRSGRRPDLKLVVMSATLDAAPLAEHLDAPVVRSEGRRFPVEVVHLEKPDERWLQDQVAAAVRRATVPGTEGDVLVFLPGASEIRQCERACEELAQHRGLVLLPLHGDLPPDEQDRAIAPNPRRKVILATNVAETSVTIDGVTCVIDAGLARIAGHSPWTGLPTLEVQKISRASAEQRAGRAGRTRPGIAYRLYTQHDYNARPAHHAPEVQRLDLAEALLELHAAGLSPRELPWLDAPDEGALHAGEELLLRLGLLQKARAQAQRSGFLGTLEITPLGARCAKLPLHPRLSRIVHEAESRGAGRGGCAVAALLGEGDLRSRDGLRAGGPTGPSDVLEQWELMREASRSRFDGQRLRALGLDAGSTRRADQSRQQLERLLQPQEKGLGARQMDEAVSISLLSGFPDRVARRRTPGGAELLLCTGGSAQLSPSSVVREAPLLLALDVEERKEQQSRGVKVRLASAIEAEWLLDLFADSITDSVELKWERARERVEAVSKLSYLELALEESQRAVKLDDEREAARAAEVLFVEARSRGVHTFADPEQLAQTRARLELVAKACPELNLTAPDDAAVDAALRSLCEGRASLAQLREGNLLQQLIQNAGDGAERHLGQLAPESLQLPGGRRAKITYTSGQPPAIESRLQDFFGMARTPTVCNGRVALVCHLLAPNGRAQQVTQDLAGFWVRHYPAVRKELMRKYPRHPWPEDGATATPPAPKPPRR
ncbi:MAG: ATP-dependent helicase HrpB [Deltaproteobacteria bacterium]|nr:ATP-dependent helicase HrpB [Deltaproteobacteria bacterium]